MTMEHSIESGKHQLQTPFSFYYDKKQYRKTDTTEFANKLKKLATFSTIEDFWRIYLFLKRPSAIESNVNIYLFREGPGIVPMWEAFPHGGCWLLKVKKKGLVEGSSILGNLWHDLVLAFIGEAFEEPTVVGLSLAIRTREDIICLWNEDNRCQEVTLMIGAKLKEVLNLEPDTVIEYKAHKDSLHDLSTFRNTQTYVFAAKDKESNQS